MKIFEIGYAKIPTNFNDLIIKRVEAESEKDAHVFFQCYLEENMLHRMYAIVYVKEYIPCIKPKNARFVEV